MPTSMHINQLIGPETRVVEVGGTCSRLPRALARCATSEMLEVALDEPTRVRLEEECPSLPGQFVLSAARKPVATNNAQLLILGPRALWRIAMFRSLRHAEWVAWENRLTLKTAFAKLVARFYRWRGKLGAPLRMETGTEKIPGPMLVVYPLLKPHAPGVRRFVPHTLGVEGFLRELSTRGIRHSVLRWFDDLPNVAPGEDIDLLVDDAQLEEVRELLDSGAGVQPVDLYSTSGLPGADFCRLPYFPPYVAGAMLDQAVTHRGLCNVPAPRDHFRSMVYHALYHKGFTSGLPSRHRWLPPRRTANHDYTSILEEMAASLGLDVPIAIEELDTWLDAEGWRPPHDMLVRLAKKNRWLRAQLATANHEAFDDQICVFLLRRKALSRGGIDRATALLVREGFEPLASTTFAPGEVDSLARTLRGGNWGSGPWPISGGPPVAALVMFDPAPIKLTSRERRKYPFVASGRLLCKERIRDALNSGYPESQHCNAIHSSNNGREAYDYLRVIMPERLDEITALAERRRTDGPLQTKRAA